MKNSWNHWGGEQDKSKIFLVAVSRGIRKIMVQGKVKHESNSKEGESSRGTHRDQLKRAANESTCASHYSVQGSAYLTVKLLPKRHQVLERKG